jgi:hypothetical protein
MGGGQWVNSGGVKHQETTPGNNPEDFKQHYDHGGSLQLQDYCCLGDIM